MFNGQAVCCVIIKTSAVMRQVLYLRKTSFCVVKHHKAQRLSDGLLTLPFAEMKTNDPISSGPMPWDSFAYLSDGEFEYKTVWEEDANLTKRVVVVCTL